jgi:hypothetical protein
VRGGQRGQWRWKGHAWARVMIACLGAVWAGWGWTDEEQVEAVSLTDAVDSVSKIKAIPPLLLSKMCVLGDFVSLRMSPHAVCSYTKSLPTNQEPKG